MIYERIFPRSSVGERKLGTFSSLFIVVMRTTRRWSSSYSSPGTLSGRRSLFKVVITFGRCFWYSGALFRELLSSQFKLRRGATVFVGGPNRPPLLLAPTLQPPFLFLSGSFPVFFFLPELGVHIHSAGILRVAGRNWDKVRAQQKIDKKDESVNWFTFKVISEDLGNFAHILYINGIYFI